VLRTEHVVGDSSKPYSVRLEQIYNPDIQLSRSLTTHALLRERPRAAANNGTPEPGAVVKDLGTAEGVARDLRDSPFRMEFDLHDVADGTYLLGVEVLDAQRSLGAATLTINVRKGLDDLVARLEADAKKAPEALRAEMLFPIDRMTNVNRGRLELSTFDPAKDFADALAADTAVKAGKNPFAGKTGDFKRHYLLETANEIMPYRMYVPTTYSSTKAFPLIIALHGLGGTESSFFDGYDKQFPVLAEKHGYIVAAPLGYRVDGGYGWGLGNPPADPVARRDQDFSEQDVMRVLELAKKQYNIDESRIYLTGHSLGAIGTWKIGPKYPNIWAAMAPFSGSGAPDTLAVVKHIPEFVVHGDDDRTVNVRGSRVMVAKMKELGIDVTYVEVPGGSHGGVVAPNLPALFDFFDHHRKTARTPSQQQ
jgi:poly(3-hydroxybutyrate) depolymerase